MNANLAPNSSQQGVADVRPHSGLHLVRDTLIRIERGTTCHDLLQSKEIGQVSPRLNHDNHTSVAEKTYALEWELLVPAQECREGFEHPNSLEILSFGIKFFEFRKGGPIRSRGIKVSTGTELLTLE